MANITMNGETVSTRAELPPVGVPAPDFTVVNTDLEEISLSDFEGPVNIGSEEMVTINQLVESFFVYLINLWALAPNPELQVQCLRFLDTQVPPEFDGLWAFVFIEFSNVARDANGQPLQSDHLTNLKRRAMGTK